MTNLFNEWIALVSDPASMFLGGGVGWVWEKKERSAGRGERGEEKEENSSLKFSHLLPQGTDKTLASFITSNLQQTLRNEKLAQVFYRVCVETAVESAFDKSSLAGLGK